MQNTEVGGEQKVEIINIRTLLVKPFIENLSRHRPLQSPQHTRMIKYSLCQQNIDHYEQHTNLTDNGDFWETVN